jgi:hypothetical protein
LAIIVERQYLSIDTSAPLSSVRLVWHKVQVPDPEKSSPLSFESGSPEKAGAGVEVGCGVGAGGSGVGGSGVGSSIWVGEAAASVGISGSAMDVDEGLGSESLSASSRDRPVSVLSTTGPANDADAVSVGSTSSEQPSSMKTITIRNHIFFMIDHL